MDLSLEPQGFNGLAFGTKRGQANAKRKAADGAAPKRKAKALPAGAFVHGGGAQPV